MMMAEMKALRDEICQQLLSLYEKEGEEILHKIVTASETWVYHYEPESKHQSMEYHHKGSPVGEGGVGFHNPGFGRKTHGYSFLGRHGLP
jgi:hypothetical protein